MTKAVTVAYEEHGPDCAEDCSCRELPLEERLAALEAKVAAMGASESGLSQYIDATRDALLQLGGSEDDLAARSTYVRRAYKAGLSPQVAASNILIMQGRPDPTSYSPRHKFSDLAGEPDDPKFKEYKAAVARQLVAIGAADSIIEGFGLLQRHRRTLLVQYEAGTSPEETAKYIRAREEMTGALEDAAAREPSAPQRFSAGASEHVSYADRQKLPARAFALPERRALLLTDAHGKVDEGHVKAAAGRLSMMRRLRHVTPSEYQEALRRIRRAGRQVGVQVAEGGDCPGWYIASEPSYAGRIHWHRDGEAYVTSDGPGARVQRRSSGSSKWVVVVGGQDVGQLASSKAEACAMAEERIRAPSAGASGAAEVAIVERTPDASPGGRRLATPKDVYRLLGPRYSRLGQETFEVLLVNLNDELMGSPVQVALGQASGVRVEVEQVLGVVVKGRSEGAAGFWCAHNHPSGTLQASPQDKDLTRRIEAARRVVAPNMEFKGHVIVTGKGWAKA
jgi:DNA repair protein RadC